MKISQKWGKHRKFFENDHASGALRAPPSIIPDHTCELAYEQSRKQDETLRNNVKNRLKRGKKNTKTKENGEIIGKFDRSKFQKKWEIIPSERDNRKKRIEKV